MSEQKFKPAQPVLVRDNDESKWYLELFSYYDEKLIYPYCCLVNNWKHCLPLEGNEHLLNTTDSPKPKWEPKQGEAVLVSDCGNIWLIRFFVKKEDDNKYIASSFTDLQECHGWDYCKPYKPKPEE